MTDKRFFLRPNFKYAEPMADTADIKLLKRVGVPGIKMIKPDTWHATIQRLVNSEVLPEGRY